MKSWHEEKILNELGKSSAENPKKWWGILKNVIGFHLETEIPPLVENLLNIFQIFVV